MLLCQINPILIEVKWFIVQVAAKKSTNPLECLRIKALLFKHTIAGNATITSELQLITRNTWKIQSGGKVFLVGIWVLELEHSIIRVFDILSASFILRVKL
jgi:hypothetical protein